MILFHHVAYSDNWSTLQRLHLLKLQVKPRCASGAHPVRTECAVGAHQLRTEHYKYTLIVQSVPLTVSLPMPIRKDSYRTAGISL